MKKFLLAAFAVFMSLSASAQLISSNTITHKKTKSGYNRFSVSYKSFKVDDVSLNGVSLDWTKGISLSSSAPLYLETGLGVMYASKSEMDGDISHKYLGVTVPIDVTYKFDIAESGVKIAPFAGIYLRGNILGKSEIEGYDEYDWYDVGGKRFNVGWQLGVGFEYKALYLGVSYGGDINELMEEVKSNTFAATLGVTF